MPFPLAGLHLGSAVEDMPPRTTGHALNVRGRTTDDRVRGGKRSGTVRTFATPADGPITGLVTLRLNSLNVEQVDGVGPACTPLIWRQLGVGVDARTFDMLGYTPGTLLHAIG